VSERSPSTLAALATVLGEDARVLGDGSVTVTSVSHESQAIAPGSSTLFACLRGEHHDGHHYAADAVAHGARALLVDHPLPILQPTAQLVVADTRRAVGPLAARVYGQPADDMTTVGITGTNGKTTTSHLLATILRAAGRSTAVFGTLSGARTTPEAPELQQRLADARDHGDEAVVMEVSSHALALHRVDGTRFDAALFTNLGEDHLDLHGTAEEYFRAKARLFRAAFTDVGVINADDAHGQLLLDVGGIDMVAYSRGEVSDVQVGAGAHSFTWRGRRVDVAIGGGFNVMNSLAAATTAAVLGIDEDTIVDGLTDAEPVPGRFERVLGVEDRGVAVVVDYAHTPDGLAEVLAAGRAVLRGGRLIVVFGAGGDRDHAKRPHMGAVAARLADRVVVTSDNPRSEDPEAIIAEIVAGMPTDGSAVVEIEARRDAAIGAAIRGARPGDLVIIAGKGHETSQTIGDATIEFDDRVVARRVLGGDAA